MTEQWQEAAESAYRNNDFGELDRVCVHALSSGAEPGKVLYWRALGAIARGDAIAGRAFLLEVLRLRPDDRNAAFRLGELEERQGDVAAARSRYAEASALGHRRAGDALARLREVPVGSTTDVGGSAPSTAAPEAAWSDSPSATLAFGPGASGVAETQVWLDGGHRVLRSHRLLPVAALFGVLAAFVGVTYQPVGQALVTNVKELLGTSEGARLLIAIGNSLYDSGGRWAVAAGVLAVVLCVGAVLACLTTTFKITDTGFTVRSGILSKTERSVFYYECTALDSDAPFPLAFLRTGRVAVETERGDRVFLWGVPTGRVVPPVADVSALKRRMRLAAAHIRGELKKTFR